MEKLCYETLEKQGYDGYLLKDAPERVLQFGEGNFLRAFVDYFIDMMNEKADFNSKVVLCQPIAPGLADMINEQEGLYTHIKTMTRFWHVPRIRIYASSPAIQRKPASPTTRHAASPMCLRTAIRAN